MDNDLRTLQTILSIMAGNVADEIDRLKGPVCQMVECAIEVLGVDPTHIKCTADLLPPGVGGLLDTVSYAPMSVLVVSVLPMGVQLHAVVAHEMIHYKQHMDGRLAHASDVATRKHVMIWEGRLYDSYNMDDPTTMPWEMEAYEQMDAVAEAMVAVMEHKIRNAQQQASNVA